MQDLQGFLAKRLSAKTGGFGGNLRRFPGLLLVASVLMAYPTHADPAPNPPFLIPPVFCFRVTDIQDTAGDLEGDRFDFEFEVGNWTGTEAFRLVISIANGGISVDGAPVIAGNSIDVLGRPLGVMDDDGNFPPADGTGATAKVGTPNSWILFASSATQVDWRRTPTTPGTGIPFRDLLGVPGPSNTAKTSQACALVVGCSVVGGNPQIPNFETIDNGAASIDGGPDNFLDGFVLTIDDFDPGEMISFFWTLVDGSGSPIGAPGSGNPFGFGVFNFYYSAAGENGPALWFCQNPGTCPGSNTGTSMGTREMFVSTSTPSGAQFGAEFGVGLVPPLVNPADNIFSMPTNAATTPLGAPSASPFGRGVGLLLMLVAGLLSTARRRRGRAS